MIYFIFIFLQSFGQGQESNKIRSTTQIIEGIHPNQQIEIQYNHVPKNLLAQTISEVLKKEKVDRLTISYNDLAESKSLKDKIEAKARETKDISIRSINEKSLPSEGPNVISKKEINQYRILLLIRTAGFGMALYVSTGSTISIAAYGAILNYLMMEALYIPNHKGQMRGVDFVSSMMKKAAQSAQKEKPNIGKRRLATIEGFVNFLTNYTLNVAMLIPFVGMTGADFSLYLDSFLRIETYQRALSIGLISTTFMSSWKMAVSRWEELKRERGLIIPSKKTQTRTINGVDFLFSFITPGFWAGHLANQVILVTMGVSGWVAYFYYDIKAYAIKKIRPIRQIQCRRLFL